MAPEPNTSVDQIFDALQLLVDSEEPLGVADVARGLEIPTSTAHRLLATVFEAGFADRSSNGVKYELGVRAYALVHGLFRQYRIQRTAIPFLARLVTQLGETTTLDVRVGWCSVRMAGFEGWHEIHAGTRIGQSLPLGDSASGLAILAHLPAEEVDGYLRWQGGGRIAPARARTLRARLAEIREAGHARVPEPGAAGSAIALPVRVEARAVAAVCVEGSGPVTAEPPRAADLGRLRKALAELERRIAGQPELARDPFAHLAPDELTAALR